MKKEAKSHNQLLYFNRIIFVLSILGTIMAVYVLQGWLRKTNIVCLTGGCEEVRKSAFSYPFGIPVPVVGLLGYTFLMVLSFLRTASLDKRLLYAVLGMATFGIFFVSWFTFTEVYYIKAICTWCAVSAVDMLVIFIVAIKSYKLLKEDG